MRGLEDLNGKVLSTNQRPFSIAQMRAVYRVDEVERVLTKLPQKEHENLRSTYERMLEK